MIDLKTLDTTMAEHGVAMEVLHPVTREPIGAQIKLVGSDSERFRNLSRELVRRRVGKKLSAASAEMLEQEALELLADCTLGWSGVMLDGQELQFSKKAAVDLYARFPWLREQADAFIADRANFLPRS